MDEPTLVKSMAGLRIAIGVGAWVAPRLTGKVFGLDPAANPQMIFMARLFGIRDVALGVGLLASSGSARQLWWQTGVMCDLADAGAAGLALRDGTLPAHAAVMSGVIALAAAGLGAAGVAASA